MPIVNLPGIKPGELKLDRHGSRVHLSWKDKDLERPALKALNPKIKLPDTAITVVHRADGSGTTFNFTTYLSDVDADWQDQVGANTAVDWPVGIGGKGNDGVAEEVKQTQGSIGYVEIAYALKTALTYTSMINHDGETVEPKLSAFQAAAANADWASAPGLQADPGEPTR